MRCSFDVLNSKAHNRVENIENSIRSAYKFTEINRRDNMRHFFMK